MNLTNEQLDQIATIAVEKILLKMPEVIGRLMENHAMLNKTNIDFYNKHPEFKNHKDVVVNVLEATEGNFPEKKYEEIIQLAIPEIQKQVQQKQQLNMEKNTNPTTNLSHTNLSNGVI